MHSALDWAHGIRRFNLKKCSRQLIHKSYNWGALLPVSLSFSSASKRVMRLEL